MTTLADLVALMARATDDVTDLDTANCTKVTPECPVSATTYQYIPNLGANIFFAAAFGALLLAQTFYAVKYRAWTFYVTMLGTAVLEIVGYVGRIQLHANVWDDGAFKTQITCLILGPSFTAAAIYLVTKHFVKFLGREYSLLRAGLYSWIFIGADICCLILQGAGGGIMAGADASDADALRLGKQLILAGIGAQIGIMVLCGAAALDVCRRYWAARRQYAELGRPAHAKSEST
ncbi:hypothetical protein KEM52_003779, partial [Ascosphaera acerosa]